MKSIPAKIVMTTAVLAGVATLTCAAQTDAQSVLQALSARISSLGDYRVTFTAQAEGTRTRGEYTVSGDSYRMSVEGVEVICNGRDRYEIRQDDREVVVDRIDPTNRSILSNPTRAFDFASDIFAASYSGTQTVNGSLCDIVTLKPHKAGSTISGVVLAVDRTTGLPASLRYTAEGLSEEVAVSVDSFSAAGSTPSSTFEFDAAAYPGYEMIDFR